MVPVSVSPLNKECLGGGGDGFWAETAHKSCVADGSMFPGGQSR